MEVKKAMSVSLPMFYILLPQNELSLPAKNIFRTGLRDHKLQYFFQDAYEQTVVTLESLYNVSYKIISGISLYRVNYA